MAQSNLGKANSYTTEVWHSDQSFMPAPPSHSIVSAQVIPEAGGDTMFASQYSAYEGLSEGMKRLLRELRAWHGGTKLATLFGSANSVTPQSHPIVRTHPETGRKALYVNRLYTYCIDGLSEAESRGLLDFLFEQRPPGIYLLASVGTRRCRHVGQSLRTALRGSRLRRSVAPDAPHNYRRRYSALTHSHG
jgi:alpha-ketoglutarate-dependent taurine dioxygenase